MHMRLGQCGSIKTDQLLGFATACVHRETPLRLHPSCIQELINARLAILTAKQLSC